MNNKKNNLSGCLSVGGRRKDFPILQEKVNGNQIVYFDNAATTQKPKSVVDAIIDFYTKYNSNIHRSMHLFGNKATTAFESARTKVAHFIGAESKELIFTKGTTESINFVAATWAMEQLGSGDEIVVTEMEHHANLIPWQQVAKKTGAMLKFIPLSAERILDLTRLAEIITEKTKLVSIVHVSNMLGVHNDITTIIKAAKTVGAKVLIDAAQSVPHQKIDVKALGCDFLAFSGHKMLAPTGIGGLYINQEIIDTVSPYQFGGGMVFEVTYDNASWCQTNRRFEAGTQPIAQAIGLGAAVDYLSENIDFKAMTTHCAGLCKKVIEGLSSMEGVHIVGPIDQLKEKGHLVSFVMDGIHAHDVMAYLASFGICARAGHNCAQPLAKKLGIEAAVRVSFYFYNTEREVDYFLDKMKHIRNYF